MGTGSGKKLVLFSTLPCPPAWPDRRDMGFGGEDEQSRDEEGAGKVLGRYGDGLLCWIPFSGCQLCDVWRCPQRCRGTAAVGQLWGLPHCRGREALIPGEGSGRKSSHPRAEPSFPLCISPGGCPVPPQLQRTMSRTFPFPTCPPTRGGDGAAGAAVSSPGCYKPRVTTFLLPFQETWPDKRHGPWCSARHHAL